MTTNSDPTSPKTTGTPMRASGTVGWAESSAK